jgi:hypothetical protein
MWAAGGCGEPAPEPGAAAGAGATAESPRTPAARAAGCPACVEMLASRPAETFAADPHAARCEACHHPHWAGRDVPVHRSCTASECHPRAWPRTRFHRVQAAAFLNCTNCHRPHTWVARGEECRSCHADLLAAAGAPPAAAGAGPAPFSHAVHSDLECGRCHDLETGHGVLRITSPADCVACHHGPPAVAACERCHAAGEIAGPRAVQVPLQLAVWDAPRQRVLPFDHARHAGIACTTCHGPGPSLPARRDCAACHAPHHAAAARCIACHPTPPPPGTHGLEVHAGGCDTCHGATSFVELPARRDLCLVCHQAQVDHMPGGSCAACHKLTPEPGGTLP